MYVCMYVCKFVSSQITDNRFDVCSALFMAGLVDMSVLVLHSRCKRLIMSNNKYSLSFEY